MYTYRICAASVLLVLAACAPRTTTETAPDQAASPALPPATATPQPAPIVDHHQHLLGPATAQAWNGPGVQTIPLPQDISDFLAERDSAFGDTARLAVLYTEDAQLLHNWGSPAVLRGRAEAAALVAALFGRPYRITPVAYSRSGDGARVAGYFSRGAGDSTRHFGQIALTLRRTGTAGWRIASETILLPGPVAYAPVTGSDLIRLLDDAGIQRALVLSVAYWYGGGGRERTPDEYDKVRAENDWVASEAARHPDRLRAFCGFNPLSAYAMEELERCHRHPHLHGLKFHFGNSRVDLRNPEHVARVRTVFAAANERRLPIVAHVRTTSSMPYGAQFSRIFIEQILPAAPDIPIQIAHLAGSGPGYTDPALDSALAVFAEARAANDPRTVNLYFDVATIVNLNITPEHAQRVAQLIRQLGVDRVLYGSDMAVGGNLQPRQGWAVFRSLLPLTEAEIRTIATNVAPYMR